MKVSALRGAYTHAPRRDKELVPAYKYFIATIIPVLFKTV
jgi:hypothetical protein